MAAERGGGGRIDGTFSPSSGPCSLGRSEKDHRNRAKRKVTYPPDLGNVSPSPCAEPRTMLASQPMPQGCICSNPCNSRAASAASLQLAAQLMRLRQPLQGAAAHPQIAFARSKPGLRFGALKYSLKQLHRNLAELTAPN